MRYALVTLIALLGLACGAALQPFPGFHISHANPSHDGREWHSCGPLDAEPECAEGWACTRDGCEWCGDDDGVETVCTAGDD